MPSPKPPRIAAVQALRPHRVCLEWENGLEETIDLAEPIGRLKALAPLRDWAVFRRVAVGEWGWSLAWPKGTDLGSDSLWRMAREQSGEAMPAARFRSWRERNGLSLSGAAKALGISRRTIAYYDSGTRLIPKTILLATKGYEAMHRRAGPARKAA